MHHRDLGFCILERGGEDGSFFLFYFGVMGGLV